MMKNNFVYLHGRLTADPESRTLESGMTVTNIIVATNDPYKNSKGEKVDESSFHRVVYWGDKAQNVAKYFKKGDGIIVTGSIRYRSTGEGDDKKYYTDISGDSFKFPLGRVADNQSKESNRQQSTKDAAQDDLPF